MVPARHRREPVTSSGAAREPRVAGTGAEADRTAGSGSDPAGLPVRVSTLELFFDLVFVFTITQLTGTLARDMTGSGAARVLLIFGLLWWMYGGYAWLTNARTPTALPERLLLLLGMAGFLIIGLAIPHAFGRRGEAVALGLGYLLVVAVHGTLYLRVNRNILRVVPFNATSALLVIAAGLFGISGGTEDAAGWALWVAALAVQVGSPLVVHPQGRFSIQPAHFTERHGALIIVAFGESVADIGIGAAGRPVTVALVVTCALALALAAALWWAYFGVGDDERAEEALTRADPAARPALALNAYFYAYIPMLLGIVALAAGVKKVIGHEGSTAPYPACLALGGGVALFLLGDVAFRRVLRIGTQRHRIAAAAACLAVTAVGVTASVAAEIALLAAVVAAALAAERQGERTNDRSDSPAPVTPGQSQ
jgi:low temperature requirement protein LtrA